MQDYFESKRMKGVRVSIQHPNQKDSGSTDDRHQIDSSMRLEISLSKDIVPADRVRQGEKTTSECGQMS